MNNVVKVEKAALVDLLKSAIVVVKFLKKNGEERTLRCTLHPSMLPALPPGEPGTAPGRQSPEHQVNVWSIDDASWRSFDIGRLMGEPTIERSL